MIVVAAVIVRNGRVLACQRSRTSKFPLKWEFPGGKVQPGEMPEAALQRELDEELGAQAKIVREIFRTQHKYEEMRETVELIFFEAGVDPSEIENRIFQKIDWVELERLRTLDFLDADREFVEKLSAGKIGK